MRQVRPWMFNGLAAVSALLFVATCVLWVRKAATIDSVALSKNQWTFSIDSHREGISFVGIWTRWEAPQPWRLSFGHNFAEVMYENAPFRWRALGFGRQRMSFVFERGDVAPVLVLNAWTAPHWSACTFFALMPLFGIVSRLRRRRFSKKSVLCPHCGYDLRATPDRCPECGSMPTPTTPT